MCEAGVGTCLLVHCRCVGAFASRVQLTRALQPISAVPGAASDRRGARRGLCLLFSLTSYRYRCGGSNAENQERDSEDYDGVKLATHLNLLGDLSATGCRVTDGSNEVTVRTRQKIPDSGRTRGRS